MRPRWPGLPAPSTRTAKRDVHCPQRPPAWKGLALIALALSCSGCFQYVPAQPETTAPGEGVRVVTTRAGAAELADVSDLADGAPIIDGTLAGVEGQALLLRVPVGRRQDGFMVSAINQTIRIPTSEIVSFQRRQFDKVSTALALAAGAGLVTAVVAFIVKPSGRDETDPEEGPDDAVVDIRLFRFNIGR
jgi:hypothetical protein